ncbi:MAG: hypothetical protein QF408_13015 [Pirellulales bacterium]|jgi:hypothetical protein|nr:hypothetical protein [Pirellulales bacterium]HJN67388.1 hypothetical protein [Pirellulales bacterium]|tara:strand:- start:770 stop:964 length:195 start_codon:yes stop_codon:yes gene_type:complete
MHNSDFLVNVVAIATVILGITILIRLPMEKITGEITNKFGIVIVTVILAVVISMTWFLASQHAC